MSGHEDYERTDNVEMGSERSFGLVFAVVFTVVGGWQLWQGRSWGWWLVAGAAVFLALALLQPDLLRPLNKAWFLFGMLLHKIVNPIVLGLLFFAVVLPTGLLMRALGKRPLNLVFDRQAASYWVRREPPGPAPETFTKQF